MAYLSEMDPQTGLLPAYLARDKGKEFRESYQTAEPFPHIVIDDFLPEALLERCLDQFPRTLGEEDILFDRSQERFKVQYLPDSLPVETRRLFQSLNGLQFVRLLENITGIPGLIPDPYFFGAGLHEIRQGGHLSIHADFNHHRPMNLERRINVLIYLNHDWRAEYGGGLELWDRRMTRCEHSIVPSFNRCVIFSTTEESNHGNPQPIDHPQGISRKSIALYYYTATWDPRARYYSTQFRTRPGTDDKPDWQVRKHEIIADLWPPLLYRAARRVKRRLLGRAPPEA